MKKVKVIEAFMNDTKILLESIEDVEENNTHKLNMKKTLKEKL
jgi:hypothetical protein